MQGAGRLQEAAAAAAELQQCRFSHPGPSTTAGPASIANLRCLPLAGYADWWWKLVLGKCYYQLGLLRDAEAQFKSALRAHECTTLYLELAKVYMRLDQPALAFGALLLLLLTPGGGGGGVTRSVGSAASVMSPPRRFAAPHRASAETYTRGSQSFPGDVHLLLGASRLYDALNDQEVGGGHQHGDRRYACVAGTPRSTSVASPPHQHLAFNR